MTVTTKVKLQPIKTPNFVFAEEPPRSRSEGFKEGAKFHISELDDDTLDELCRQFKDDLFAKARNPA